jgi:hypothetical protein
MSKPILNQLFDGEIYPAENIKPVSSEYRELSEKIEMERDYFESKLPESDRSRFEDFYNMFSARGAINAYADFSAGYRLGAQLTYAAFSEDVAGKSEDE